MAAQPDRADGGDGSVAFAGGGRGRRGRPVAVVWALALAAVVAVGLAGRQGAPEGAPGSDTAAGLLAEGDGGNGGARPRPARPSIVLTEPAVDGAITTPELHVRGYLERGSGPVWIALYARRERLLASRSVEIERPTSGGGPVPPTWFETSFGLPGLRPNGAMTVVVVAYDGDGMPVAALRRPVTIGSLAEPAGMPAEAPAAVPAAARGAWIPPCKLEF